MGPQCGNGQLSSGNGEQTGGGQGACLKKRKERVGLLSSSRREGIDDGQREQGQGHEAVQ